MQEVEIWKPIEGYEGRYEVSDQGRVRSLLTNMVLNDWANIRGYRMVALFSGSRKSAKQIFVHRLVARAFIPNPNNYPDVNHKDENPSNNKLNNLEWMSHHDNLRYSWDRHKNYKNNIARMRIVQQIDLSSGNVVAEYKGLSDAGKAVGTGKHNIYDAIKKGHNSMGFAWRYKD